MTDLKRISLSFLHSQSMMTWVLIILYILIFSNSLLMLKLIALIWAALTVQSVTRTAWNSTEETKTLLYDTLLVPYSKKKTFFVYCLWTSLFCIALTFIFMLLYAHLHNLKAIQLNTGALIQFSLFDYVFSAIWITFIVICFYASNLSKRQDARDLLRIAAWVASLMFAFSNQAFHNALIWILAFVLIMAGLISLNWIPEKKKKEKSVKLTPIEKNLFGVIKLSKMMIVQDKPVLNRVLSFFHTFCYYTIARTILRIIKTGIITNHNLFDSWIPFLFILLLFSILNSNKAIRQIYESKNMLKVIPVKHESLFSACAVLALFPVVIAQLAVILMLISISNYASLDVFLKTQHPYEQMLHMLSLAILPITTFLICFIIYAQKDRSITKIIIFCSLVAVVILYFGLREILQGVLIVKTVMLLAALLLPYPAVIYCKNHMDQIRM